MTEEQQSIGWTAVKTVNLGRMGAGRCALCHRELRYMVICKSPDGMTVGLGGECAARLQGIEGTARDAYERLVTRDQMGSEDTGTPLKPGFLPAPVPSLNGFPIVGVVTHLRVSFLKTVEPKPFHISEASGYWAGCCGEGCLPCFHEAPIRGSLHAVCSWKVEPRGGLHVPSSFPFGCTSFRGLALRECDVQVMQDRTPGKDARDYDWQFSRLGRNVVVKRVGTTSYNLVRGYVDNIARVHTTNGVWNNDVVPYARNQESIDAEEAEITRMEEAAIDL